MNHPFLLVGAGLLAGAMNSAAGGGTFVTLPALIFAGLPAVGANTSSTVALFPGSLAGAWAYRDDFRAFQEGLTLRAMLAASLTGSALGALLLLFTSARVFEFVVPWLLLFGTLTFALGRRAEVVLRRFVHIGPRAMLGAQLLLGVYAGYFGGAVGIMMMATWSLFGMRDIRSMNAAKTLLVGASNAVAVVCFIAAGRVWWPETCLVLVAGTAGGYLGARLTRRLDPERVRLGITAVNVAMTGIVFWRAFGRG
ncbi:MAG: sulfite exporter TauE/SafE family protein [Gemmatimonadetes bacterium]|nr:sulfite exporter TauE/SafE family protein [Gemmatimonadota bacterium]